MPRTQDLKNSPLDQFLTPESMLTPGVAGATAMMITNALTNNFSMPPAWTALILSFGFGLLAIVKDKPPTTKTLFYVLNSLVIFCVASGANNIGLKAQKLTFLDNAFAQETSSPQPAYDCASIYSQIASILVEINKIQVQDDNSPNSNARLSSLFAQYSRLTEKGQSIPGCSAYGGHNSIVNNPSQIYGGPNSSFNNPNQISGANKGGFFKKW